MRDPDKQFDRQREVNRQRRLLEKLASPRLSMALIALLTAGSGFLASWLLRLAGIHVLWLRYPLATAIAYLVFLLLLWIWLHHRDSDTDIDIDDFSGDGNYSAGTRHVDGSGADATPGSSGGGDWFDVDADLLGVVIVALIALAGLLFAAFSIISIAPLLLAELLVDAALAAGLYRHVRGMDRHRHWLSTALAHTLWRFGAVAALAGLAGALMQWLVPGADSIGDIFLR